MVYLKRFLVLSTGLFIPCFKKDSSSFLKKNMCGSTVSNLTLSALNIFGSISEV